MAIIYEINYYNLKEEEIGFIHILADNFYDALEWGESYLDEAIGSEDWEILKTEMLPQINIVNLEDYVFNNIEEEENHFKWTGDCDCPSCMVRHVELDRIMKFTCHNLECKAEIKVADIPWITIQCPQCNETIYHEYLVRDPETGLWNYKDNK